MRAGDLASDRQAEPAAERPRHGDSTAVESLEHAILLVGRDSWAVVDHVERDVRPIRSGTDANLASGFAMADRILDEVAEHAEEIAGITVDPKRSWGLDRQAHLPALGLVAPGIGELLDDLREIDARRGPPAVSDVEARERQQIFREAAEPPGLLRGSAKRLASLLQGA